VAKFDTKPIDKSKPDRAELLQQILQKNKIWDIRKKEFTSKKSQDTFNEIYLSFYIAWITKNLNFPFQGNLCFVGLDKENSLLVIPPINRTAAYINSSKNGLEIYKDNIFSGLILDDKNCPICSIKNYVSLNVRQLPSKSDLIKEISFLDFTHDQCSKISQDKILQDLSKKIISKPELSILTGGYGFVIRCPSEIIHDICLSYFSEVDSQKNLSSIIDDVFTAVILTDLMAKNQLGKIVTNQSITIGDISTSELDGIGISTKNSRVIVIEMTNLYDTAYHSDLADTTEKQLPKHFKDKVRTFNDLDNFCENSKFKLDYFYIYIKSFDKELKGSLEYGVVKNNPNFYLLNLEPEFTLLKGLFANDMNTDANLYLNFEKSFKKFRFSFYHK
jgi:hypothetical protein